MPKRPENGFTALVILVVCGFSILALVAWTIPYSKGYQAADRDHQSAYTDDQEEAKNAEECGKRETPEEAIECYKDARETSREQQIAEQDLDAQREMANWAEGMLWATIFVGCVTICITGLGVYYVRLTLEKADETNLAAVKSSEAAQEANRIMRSEQRPWVVFDFEPTCEFIDHGNSGRACWRYDLVNMGRSPAYDVVMHWNVAAPKRIPMSRDLSDFIETSKQQHRRGFARVIFPQQSREDKTSVWGFNEYKGEKGNEFWLFACVTYKLDLSESPQVGVDARIFKITRPEDKCGPFAHRLIDYTLWRIVE